MGLMGASTDKQNAFGANESVSVGDAVSYADRLHSLYTGDKAKFEQSDPWYKVYIDYAVTDGILEAAPEDCTQYITRAAFAQLISKCMAVYLAEPVADLISVATTALMFHHQFGTALKKLKENTSEA